MEIGDVSTRWLAQMVSIWKYEATFTRAQLPAEPPSAPHGVAKAQRGLDMPFRMGEGGAFQGLPRARGSG